MNKIVIDIMSNKGMFVDTMRIEPELNMITGFDGDRPKVSVSAIQRVIENRRPTLRNKDYRVLPCTDKYIFDYDYE